MFTNAILLALRALRRNVLRSILTMLGIIIGVAAVIILVTLGGGATQQVTDQIASLGSNLIIVTPGKRLAPGQRSIAQAFRIADADALAREIPELSAVAPLASRASTAIFANRNWTTIVNGSTEQFFNSSGRRIAEGRAFTASEARLGASVCVIGETVRQRLFGSQPAVGNRIRLGKLSCEVVGVFAEKGQSSLGTDQDDLVLMPLRTFQRRLTGSEEVSLIQASVRDGASTDQVKGEVARVMRSQRHIAANEDDDFSVMDLKEVSTMLSVTTRTLTALLGAVAAVSLLVGGIGIMNIMLVSVTERTREIGTRLAIGALEREVLLQFLIEAVVLAVCGGLIGAVLAVGASAALADALEVPFILDVPIIVISLLFAAAVGIVFGYFPARKAARLDPIEALRHE
jgi:putative ABC transport system permease protein